MPRTRKTQSGAPAQSLGSGIAGVRYGEGEDLRALQQAAPAPDNRAGGPPGTAAPQPGLPASPVSPPPMPKPGLLTAPTTRPNEPLTAGLVSGPGPGPEALVAQTVSPQAKFFRELALATGRKKFDELARRSGG